MEDKIEYNFVISVREEFLVRLFQGSFWFGIVLCRNI